jgi:polysaccharide export outer membrane protein
MGFIDMPVIGSVKAAGLTKAQLQTTLETKLTDNVRNPSVLVRLLQFNVNVLGEVRAPGTQKFNVDRVTIIDALSAAGDLTDFGKREDIMVIREQDGKKVYHTVDLRSKTLFQSPVYFLQPNDIVYVGPNKNKLKNIDVDPDAQRKTGLVLTVVSLVVSIASLIIFSFR